MKNSIMFNFTKRSLGANKTRTVVSIIGVMLSTALICGVFTTVTSIHAAMLKRTISTEGSWSAMSQNVDPKHVDKLVASEHTRAAASSTVLGTAQLSGKIYTHDVDGVFQIRTLPQQIKGSADTTRGLTITPTITEGTYPTQTNQLALPERFRETQFTDANLWSDEKINVGSTIHVNISDANTTTANSETAELRSYTVSGFYEATSPFFGNSLVAGDNLLVALASPNSANYSTKGQGMVWFELTGFSTQDELTNFVDSILSTNPDVADKILSNNTNSADQQNPNTITRTIFHSNLLRYQGLRGQSATWDALWNFGVFLAVIISVASIVLIYNSFAISVAERTRQFGLLSSLGASKKQMRRTVYLESILIGVIGIPLGIIAGIGGVAAALQIAKQGFTVLLNSNDGQTVSLSVSSFALALSAAFELVVLLIGAAVPALRASRLSPMSAIRQTADIKMSKRLTCKITSTTHGIYARLAGIAGTLSSRNLSRSSSRGTTIVVSLAVSVTLIVITGNFVRILLPIIDAQNNYSDADIAITLYSTNNKTAVDSSKILEDIENNIPGLTCQERVIDFQVSATTSGDALTSSMKEYVSSSFSSHSPSSNYSNYSKHSNTYVDTFSVRVPSQETWDKLVKKYHVDKDNGILVLNNMAAVFNEKQQIIEPFTNLNSMDLYTWSHKRGLYLWFDSMGTLVVPIYPSELNSDSNQTDTSSSSNTSDTTAEPIYTPLDALGDKIATHTVTSIALVQNTKTDAPYLPQDNNGSLNILMAPELANQIITPANDTMVNVYYTAQNSAKATEQLSDALEAADLANESYHISDLSTDRQNQQLVTQTMLLFLLLFTGIMVLIAIANVFNTLCNSMMLRTREFAVLRSVGMDEKQFNLMIFCECLSYALRGLVIGAVLSIGACWIFWKLVIDSADTSSINNSLLTFKLPLPSLLDASICVVVVLIVSVVYALRKTHATNVVEVLRNEVI
ncbi:ABC transporter permease [Atopobium fossor]|uniref:ABC transporter permease n=1 Tax=Atopobium fossor TaxID=39487 RepID=UPI0004256AC1|nr:ABC transporter permease [Atopobium fossor]